MLASLLSGCEPSEELYAELSEREANDIVAILQFNDFAAQKQDLGKGLFAVEIPTSKFSRAIDLLHGWGYPRSGLISLGDLFKPAGIVPTQMEEQIRFIYGISQELTETLGYLNGVIDSRVHIALGNIEGTPLIGPKAKKKKNTASVFILYDDTREDLGLLIPKIKQLVGNSMPNLAVDDVVVLAQPAVGFEFGGTTETMQGNTFKIAGLSFRRNDIGYIGAIFIFLLLMNAGAVVMLARSLLRRPA